MNMDKPLKRVSIVGLLLIFALMINVNYIQAGESDALKDNKLNNRKLQDVFKHPRGKILAGATVLAHSELQPGKKDRYGRTYEKGAAYEPIVGYFNGDARKLELAYNSLLNGTAKEVRNQHWFDQFIGKPTEGADIETTIDPAAQEKAYNLLSNGGTDRRGAVVVMDIRTGAIKVAAGFPSFDPNTIAPQKGEAGGRQLQILDGVVPSNATAAEKEAAERNNRKKNAFRLPLEDKAFSTLYFPGSSFKIVVTALAMDQMGLTPNSSVFTGTLPLSGNNTLPNSHDGGACSGQAPLKDAFAESCNGTFGDLAQKLGIQKLATGAEKFGFSNGNDTADKRIPIEPQGTNDGKKTDMFGTPSVVPVEEKKGTPTDKDQVARFGIGQGSVGATPLQMAMVAAAVAHKGKIMRPYLVDKVRSAQQKILHEAQPEEFSQAMRPETADAIKEMMQEVVRSGTAKNLNGQNIAGKTGTADQVSPGTSVINPNLNGRWFVGYSPFDNPRYAFAVVTEGPGPGANGAGPIAAEVMRVVNK